MRSAFKREGRLVGLLGVVLGAGVLACYWPATHFGFVNYDDNAYVYECHWVRRGLSWPGLIWAFKSITGGNWIPLVWLSHMADCQVYRLQPGGHHFTNVLLHAANAVLLFLVLKRMTGAIWRSAFAAAIFAWHPMHVESVAWVSERKDVLSGLFFILTLWAYVRYVGVVGQSRCSARIFGRRGNAALPSYGLVLLLFALGLMSKPMLVTLPLVLLLLDYWPLQRTESVGKLFWEKLPFLALSAAASVAALWAQHGAGAAGSAPLPLRLENAAVSCVAYLTKLFWPVALAVLYPFPNSIPIREVVGAVAGLGAISWAVLRERKTRRYLAVGWFWFLGTLAPVIGLVQVGMQSMADRYTYIPYMGLGIMLSWGLAELAGTRPRGRAALAGVAVLALGCGAAAARAQVKYWQNSSTLFEHALKVTSGNYVAHANLGIALAMNGKTDEAVKHFQEAIRLKPEIASPYNSLGKIYALQHRPDDALAASKEAARLAPNDAVCLNDLAWIYATCPKTELRNGPEAVRLATRACEITQRQEPSMLDTLAAAYAETGRFDEAIKTTEEMRAVAAWEQDGKTVDMARERLELYKSGQPYRE